MSTWWKIVCRKRGHVEFFHTGRSTGGAEEERERAENLAKEPCPECRSTDRELRP